MTKKDESGDERTPGAEKQFSAHEAAAEQSDLWRRLCDRYLPLKDEESSWRYSRARMAADPDQGWKLHVSATILSAAEALARIGPLLSDRAIAFKAPVSLLELGRLNAGLHYGYTQIGKCFTIYPQTEEEAVRLARELHELTVGIAGPLIPFDRRYRDDSAVFYRYGAFDPIEIENPDGSRSPAVRDRDGNLIADQRDGVDLARLGIADPFIGAVGPSVRPVEGDNPLKSRYRIFKALTQRGKGGVFLAVDVAGSEPRMCVVKEGRRHGETDWQGRDGYSYVRREGEVLKSLGPLDGPPTVYDEFDVGGNRYLVTEWIAGASLELMLGVRKRRLPIRRALMLGSLIAVVVGDLHHAGWVWRDCKPANLIFVGGKAPSVRPVDFEGAVRIGEPPLSIAGTPGFVPPEWLAGPEDSASMPAGDIYALGAVLYLLVTGRFFSPNEPVPAESLRRGMPKRVSGFIDRLLADDPALRPASAQEVRTELGIILAGLDVSRDSVGTRVHRR